MAKDNIIAQISRTHGAYVLMCLGIAAIQWVLDYGLLESLAGVPAVSKGGWTDPLLMEKAAASVFDHAPLVIAGILLGVVLVAGAGLVVDIIVLMKWSLARSRQESFWCRETLRPGVWNIPDLVKLFIVFFFAVTCVRALLFFCSLYFGMAGQESEDMTMVLGTLVLYGVLLAMLLVWQRKRQGAAMFPQMPWFQTLRQAAFGIVAYIGFVPPFVILVVLSVAVCQLFGVQPQPHELVNVLAQEKNIFMLVYLGVLTTLIAPVVEEIVFRGVIYGALRKSMGFFGAAAASALLFSLAHANVAQTLPVLGMGVVLAMLYEWTGSLIASILFHVLNNTVAFVLTMSILSVTR